MMRYVCPSPCVCLCQYRCTSVACDLNVLWMSDRHVGLSCRVDANHHLVKEEFKGISWSCRISHQKNVPLSVTSVSQGPLLACPVDHACRIQPRLLKRSLIMSLGWVVQLLFTCLWLSLMLHYHLIRGISQRFPCVKDINVGSALSPVATSALPKSAKNKVVPNLLLANSPSWLECCCTGRSHPHLSDTSHPLREGMMCCDSRSRRIPSKLG